VNAASGAPVRVGVLGCGSIAYWAHLRVLRRVPGATLTAAADPDPAARDRARRLVSVPIHEHPQDLLARHDVDAIIISAPTHLHAALATSAADCGKHFYLEKPIATDAAGAAQVVAAAERARVIGVMGFNRRLHPLVEQARRILSAGRIGRVRAVQTAFCEPTPIATMPGWKRRRATGGGVLLDLASHHLDLLRWLLDDEVAAVSASLRSDLTEHDTARLQLVTRGGVEVQSLFSFCTGLADFLEFYGERGTLRVDRHSPALTLRLPRRFGYGIRYPTVIPTGAAAAWRLHRVIRPSVDPSYRRSLQVWVELLRGRPGASASLLDGLRSLETVLAAEGTAVCALS
jgi:predicted dehydrogenase